MRPADKVSAEQVINRDPVVANAEESLSQLRNKMEKNRMRAIPVVDNEETLEGVVGYRDLIRFAQFNPEDTKLEKVMHQAPEFELNDSIVDLCSLRVNSGRKMLVHTSGDVLEGVIGENELLKAFKDIEDLKDIEVEEVSTEEVISVFEEDSVEKARHSMLDNNVSRLPVLDEEGKLTGVIDSVDVLKMLVPVESMDAGGTSGGRSGKQEINTAGGGEKQKLSDVTVDQIMERNVSVTEESLKGLEAVQQMLQMDRKEVFKVEGSYPEEVVTLKDFVAEIAGRAEKDTVLVSLTGLELPEEKASVHEKIENQLRGSLGRKLDRPEELSLRIKKSEKDGKKHRWELQMKLFSEYGVTSIEEEGWELLDAVDEALNKLNEVIRRKHQKESEHRS